MSDKSKRIIKFLILTGAGIAAVYGCNHIFSSCMESIGPKPFGG